MWNPNAGQPRIYPPGGPMPPSTSGCPGVTIPINPPSVNPAYPPGTAPPGCFPGNPAYPPGTAFGPGHPRGYPGFPPPGPCPPPGHYPPPGPCPLAPGVVGPGIVMDKKMRKKMKKAHKMMHKHHKHGKHSSSSSSSSSDSD